MSDQGTREAILQMEEWLRQDTFPADAEAIKAWHERFTEEVRTAERGPGWTGLVERSHAIVVPLQEQLRKLEAMRDALRIELGTQAQGERALKAYKPSKQ